MKRCNLLHLPERANLPGVLSLLLLLIIAALQGGKAVGQTAPAAEVLGAPVRSDDPEELRYLILSPLLERYAREQAIAVTPAEIDAYLQSKQRALAEDRENWQARRDEIVGALDNAALADAERATLRSERDTLDQLLASPEATGGTETAEELQAEREIATAFIRQWKINQALYRQYGGRIIYQQGGPEPLDAYREFLEEQQAQGAFSIRDQALEATFWRYYRRGEYEARISELKDR